MGAVTAFIGRHPGCAASRAPAAAGPPMLEWTPWWVLRDLKAYGRHRVRVRPADGPLTRPIARSRGSGSESAMASVRPAHALPAHDDRATDAERRLTAHPVAKSSITTSLIAPCSRRASAVTSGRRPHHHERTRPGLRNGRWPCPERVAGGSATARPASAARRLPITRSKGSAAVDGKKSWRKGTLWAAARDR